MSAPSWYSTFQPGRFLGFDSGYEDADAVILPVPFETSVSYGRGTAEGPAALLDASAQVEIWDEEFDSEPLEHFRMHTLDPVPPAFDGAAMNTELAQLATCHLDAGKWILAVGGEHAITPGLVQAHAAKYPGLGVLQVDAHSDLRDSYDGNPWSHASAMARVLPHAPVVGVGIRSTSSDELGFYNGERHRAFPARTTDLVRDRDAIIAALPAHVYLTFDIDALDPALVPGTGTPEPGGLGWWETLAFLRAVAACRTIVGADIVELAPIPGSTVSEFVAARLAYKILSYALMPRNVFPQDRA